MAKNKKQFVTDANGKITAILLPIEEYQVLLEDLNDYKIAAQFLQQKLDGTLETVTLKEVKQDLDIRQNQLQPA
jgi:DNA polymerase III sliding clamp (beta) subunit (PCNA family)